MHLLFRVSACLLSFLACLSSSLFAQQYDWAAQFSSPSQSYTHSIVLDANQNVVMLFEAYGSMDIDPGPANNTVLGNNLIVKLDSNGHLLWGGGFVISSGSLSPRGLVCDAAGNIYVLGEMQGTADFDIGPGVDIQGPGSGVIATYFCRYSATGQYLGTKILNNVSSQLLPSSVLAIDDLANIYFVGSYSSTADLDMGAGVYNVSPVGSQNACLIKYDSTLALQWAVPLAGPYTVAVTSDRVYVAGEITGSVDVDPGAGTATLTNASGYEDLYLATYTLNGNFVWARQWDCNDPGIWASAKANSAGDILVGIRYEGNLDLNPSAAITMSTGIGGGDVVTVMLDSSGTYHWGRRIGSTVRDEFYGIELSNAGDAYLLPIFSGTIDMDAGAGQTIMTVPMVGNFDAAVVKYNHLGQMVWAEEIEGMGNEWMYAIALDPQDNVYFGGEFQQTLDVDPSPGGTANLIASGNSDAMVVKWSKDACSNLALSIDQVQQGTCQNSTAFMQGSASSGTPPYAYQWNTTPTTMDSLATTASVGIFTLAVTDAHGCARTRDVLVQGPTLLGAFDLTANLIAGNFRPGEPTIATIDASNSGCNLVSGQVKLALDPLVSYQSAIPSPSLVTTDTLYWNTPPLNYDSAHFIIQVTLLSDSAAQSGDTVHLGLVITPTAGDHNPLDNVHSGYAFPIVNSYDPNLKDVFPLGQCEEHYVLKTNPLNYTIQFQNTGTAEALEVAIRDSLDPALDLNTLKIVASSHAMITEILPGNVLVFRFHDIHLPDSNSNEAGSHGYVTYEISPISTVLSGTRVNNFADIFFDLNPAVRTPTCINTLVGVIPTCPVGIVPTQADAHVQIAPNPGSGLVLLRLPSSATQVQIVNPLGQIMWQQPMEELLLDETQDYRIDVSAWPAGIYFVGNSKAAMRLQVIH